MFRIAAALVVTSVSLLSSPSRTEAAAPATAAAAQRPPAVRTVGYRYGIFRGSARSSTGRRPGTGFTPWYLLPKTDPRRFNGPHYYWK